MVVAPVRKESPGLSQQSYISFCSLFTIYMNLLLSAIFLTKVNLQKYKKIKSGFSGPDKLRSAL